MCGISADTQSARILIDNCLLDKLRSTGMRGSDLGFVEITIVTCQDIQKRYSQKALKIYGLISITNRLLFIYYSGYCTTKASHKTARQNGHHLDSDSSSRKMLINSPVEYWNKFSVVNTLIHARERGIQRQGKRLTTALRATTGHYKERGFIIWPRECS